MKSGRSFFINTAPWLSTYNGWPWDVTASLRPSQVLCACGGEGLRRMQVSTAVTSNNFLDG